MKTFHAATYDRFAAERERPARDLIARLVGPAPRRILDLGCGSGLATQALAEVFPGAEIVGVDISANMLAAAARKLPGVRFVQGDAASYDTSGFDLVFANAVMHWVPGHLGVLQRIARALPEGGRLAVQSPDNEDEPSHRLMREVAARLAVQGSGAREPIGSFADYEAALVPPCAELDLWRTRYAHRLGGPDDIVKWVEGAGLKPYLDGLVGQGRAAYLAEYRAEVAAAYPASPSGVVLFGFPRLFLVATRGRG
jgi:trans-aconitate 2-methyltransferase